MKFTSTPEAFPGSGDRLGLEQFFADDRLQALCDMFPDGLIIVNRKGTVIYMNLAAESMNEVRRKTMIGQPLLKLLEESQLVYGPLMDDFTEGARINRRVQDASGHSYAILTRSLSDVDGNPNYFLVMIRNLGRSNDAQNMESVALDMNLISDLNSRDIRDHQSRMVGCPLTTKLIDQGLRTIALGSNLLLLGESGVGKTELARYLHQQSELTNRPFVHINCSSIPDTLFESEMFGYERGSFTGASTRGKKGLIEGADGGTLFLDEIGEIPLMSQAKLLQVIETGQVQRVGSTTPRQLKMQIIAATNCDLRSAIREGCFRQDLYYRLSVITLTVPPLRDRRYLLPTLIDHFLAKVNTRRPTPLQLDEACRNELASYPYPGNIRELQNVIEFLAIVCEDTATVADLSTYHSNHNNMTSNVVPCGCHKHSAEVGSVVDFGDSFDLREKVRSYEHHIIRSAIQHAGTKRGAAKLLNVDIATIVRKSKESGSD